MKRVGITGLVLSLALTAGCASGHRESNSAAHATAAAQPAPIEPGQPANTAGPTGVSKEDLALAKSLSRLLRRGPGIPPIVRNMRATVADGVITLRGTVPSEHDRIELVRQVRQLPGLARVKDELALQYR